MLIDQLNKLLHEASTKPSLFWSYNFYLSQKAFINQLEEIAKTLEENTEAKKTLKKLILIIKNDEIDELVLAKGLHSLVEIFELSGIKNKKLDEFKKLSANFQARASEFNAFKKKRAAISKNLNKKEQVEYDSRLFQNEGISYCLEYYLSIYKQLSKFTSEKEKQTFIEVETINLGHGNLPGLKKDLAEDESLHKFILLILNDEIRNELVRAYYNYKLSTDIEKALGRFILELLTIFEKQGIENLTSTFLKPYGDKPKLKDLIKIFKDVS